MGKTENQAVQGLQVVENASTVAPETTTDAKEVARLHKEHRQRVRERYAATGFEGFSSHEILEYLLFYAIPRHDTNPIAHTLINKYGSLSAVLEAPYEELAHMEGMGPVSAQFLSMLPQLARVYLMDRQISLKSYDATAIKRYLQPMFVGATTELLILMLFDNGMHLLACRCVAKGSISKVQACLRDLADLAIRHRATAAVLAHNHPSGFPFPSEPDKATTIAVGRFFEQIDVTLLEHFVFTERSCVPMLLNDDTFFRTRPSDIFNDAFFKSFYASLDTNDPTDKEDPPVVLKNDLIDQF